MYVGTQLLLECVQGDSSAEQKSCATIARAFVLATLHGTQIVKNSRALA